MEKYRNQTHQVLEVVLKFNLNCRSQNAVVEDVDHKFSLVRSLSLIPCNLVTQIDPRLACNKAFATKTFKLLYFSYSRYN